MRAAINRVHGLAAVGLARVMLDEGAVGLAQRGVDFLDFVRGERRSLVHHLF